MAVVYFIQLPLFLMNSEITAEMCDATEADIKNVCMAHKKKSRRSGKFLYTSLNDSRNLVVKFPFLKSSFCISCR